MPATLMADTLAQQLANVQAAIANVENGVQSTTDDDGHTLVYPSLEVLYKREERLQRRIERGSTGRIKAAEF